MQVSQINNKNFGTTPDTDANMRHLADIMTQVEAAYGSALTPTSGLRDIKDQIRIYAEKNAALKAAGKPEISVPLSSKHLYGQAVDCYDPDGALWKWCMVNMDLMVKLGIYFEDKGSTPTWVHFQSVPPKSGKRIFIP